MSTLTASASPTPADDTTDAPAAAYVRTDEHGVMRVGDGRCRLDGLVYGFLDGESPEALRLAYPSLTLEQVYGGIAHYLAHRDAVDAYLREQEAIFDRLKAESDRRFPLPEKLRKAIAERDADRTPGPNAARVSARASAHRAEARAAVPAGVSS